MKNTFTNSGKTTSDYTQCAARSSTDRRKRESFRIAYWIEMTHVRSYSFTKSGASFCACALDKTSFFLKTDGIGFKTTDLIKKVAFRKNTQEDKKTVVRKVFF
ncbi:hypothetical protein TNCT_148181 [Trichonephila clavata]|uniref:Uncharacterized protein n=1 Tax=Trichonephila clavata TaxID=2740835 RepID=A0A8X6HPY6_TRICU|nr:hypothetical protein TNCT_148181 [Trichonephila clavata]